ncbi:hypothetical protein NC661_21065 [Aquibacillus koreensis]|uniref:DUF3221 domain-containing protein n=1 Tax=Aquibacillus koreensis TaxID=279446 RepID=A0A9X3WN57_9BACI|nr:hypothetical protein [Aquibacillus koreensis]MCT2535322.1 hypothetical protein [Aquibacillus koreensis]MDC3422837.1 hypothetical protein [Aquibacillus koreensis]
MKKLIVYSLFIVLLLSGCSDFKGRVLEMKESSIVVGTDDPDPETTYPTYEILIDDKTEFTGKVDEFSDLKEDSIVKLWILDKGDSNKIDNKLASKIAVE